MSSHWSQMSVMNQDTSFVAASPEGCKCLLGAGSARALLFVINKNSRCAPAQVSTALVHTGSFAILSQGCAADLTKGSRKEWSLTHHNIPGFLLHHGQLGLCMTGSLFHFKVVAVWFIEEVWHVKTHAAWPGKENTGFQSVQCGRFSYTQTKQKQTPDQNKIPSSCRLYSN